jgi:hypothetical protein
MDKAIMLAGSIKDVHESATDDFIIKGSKWFTANYSEASEVLKIVKRDYDEFYDRSQILMEENREKFSMIKMKEVFEEMISPYVNKPKEVKINIPQLTKL